MRNEVTEKERPGLRKKKDAEKVMDETYKYVSREREKRVEIKKWMFSERKSF